MDGSEFKRRRIVVEDEDDEEVISNPDEFNDDMNDPDDEEGEDIIYAPIDLIDSLLLKYPHSILPVDADRLHWAPLYVTDPKKDKWSFKAKTSRRAVVMVEVTQGVQGQLLLQHNSLMSTTDPCNVNKHCVAYH